MLGMLAALRMTSIPSGDQCLGVELTKIVTIIWGLGSMIFTDQCESTFCLTAHQVFVTR